MSTPLTINERAEIIHGGKLSDEFKQYMLRVKQATGIRDNDEIWTVLILTTHITDAIIQAKKEISSTPETLERVSENIIQSYRETARIAIDEASAIGLKALAKSVAGVANKVARQTATKQMWQWGFSAVVVAIMALTLVYIIANSSGDDAGYGRRLKEEKIEKAAMNQTPAICANNIDNKTIARKK